MITQSAQAVQRALLKVASPAKAKTSAWFFKTGVGQYGYGDVFIGVTVPEQRKVAKRFVTLPLVEIGKLLHSKIHEHRLTGLLILTLQFQKAPTIERKKIYRFYFKHLDRINNWDLVDLSAPNIVGAFLLTAPRDILYTLVKRKNLWHRRVAIVATYRFIKVKELTDTFALAKLLLTDTEDLIHKATGWMLREAGKVDQVALIKFLDQHATVMPRTMLRYAIEKFPEKTRKKYLTK